MKSGHSTLFGGAVHQGTIGSVLTRHCHVLGATLVLATILALLWAASGEPGAAMLTGEQRAAIGMLPLLPLAYVILTLAGLSLNQFLLLGLATLTILQPYPRLYSHETWSFAQTTAGAQALELNWLDLVLVAASLEWLAAAAVNPKLRAHAATLLRSPLASLGVLWLVANLVSLYPAAHVELGLYQVVDVLRYEWLFFLVALQMPRPGGLRMIQFALVGALGLEAILGLAEYYAIIVLGYPLVPSRVFYLAKFGGQLTYHICGTTRTPALLCILLATCWFMAFANYLRASHRWRGAGLVVVLSLGGVAMILTMSRGGLISFGVGLVVMGVTLGLQGQLPWHRMRPLVAIGWLCVVLVIWQYGAVLTSRFENLESVRVRLQLLEPTLAMIQQHPLVGIGVNQFAERLPDFATWGIEYDQPPHNVFLLLAAELGLVGVLCFVTIVGVATFQALRLAWTTPRWAPQLAALGAACVAMAVNDLASFTMRSPPIQGMLWLVVGAIAGCTVAIKREQPQPSLAGPQTNVFADQRNEEPR